MKNDKKWYQKTLGVAVLLILFFPVGLFLMWKFTKWNKTIKWIITGFFSLIILSGAFGDNKPSPSNPTQQSTTPKETGQVQPSPTTKPTNTNYTTSSDEVETYLVTKVIDGDTIEIENGQHIRYIGIDTPETVDPNRPVQCFGQEASNKNKELVLNKRVRLGKDISETDKYGRLLRYVWIDTLFVNDYLVRQGYANSSSYPPDIKYQEQFTQAQQEAVANNRGLWGTTCKSFTQTPVKPTSYVPGNNCNIKGNINAEKEKIYHLPGCQSYNKTKIDTSAGERWFCTEQEAQQAGWRKAGNCP